MFFSTHFHPSHYISFMLAIVMPAGLWCPVEALGFLSRYHLGNLISVNKSQTFHHFLSLFISPGIDLADMMSN
jgi:hypothetical protein